jgi:hypothetical protein
MQGAPAIGRGSAIASGRDVFVWGPSQTEEGGALAGLYSAEHDSWALSEVPDSISTYRGVYATSSPGALVAFTPTSNGSFAVNLFDVAANAWSAFPIPDTLAPLGIYAVWLGDALLLFGGYIDTTDPNQCTNVPDGQGCDPASSYEPVLEGELFNVSCGDD